MVPVVSRGNRKFPLLERLVAAGKSVRQQRSDGSFSATWCHYVGGRRARIHKPRAAMRGSVGQAGGLSGGAAAGAHSMICAAVCANALVETAVMPKTIRTPRL